MNDGGPAFPDPGVSIAGRKTSGMTLRDYFAAAALQGVLAEQGAHAIVDTPRAVCAAHATLAYALADAMLAERERTA